MESATAAAAAGGGGGGGGGGGSSGGGGGGGVGTPLAARAGAGGEPPSRDEIMATFQEMQRQRDMYIQKVSELNVEHSEYRRVVEIIKPLDSARKCFQLINSVLVERTLAEAAPIVEMNRDNLAALIKDLEGRHTKLVADIREFSTRFGSALWGRWRLPHSASARPIQGPSLTKNATLPLFAPTQSA